jgi:hypothetical protein
MMQFHRIVVLDRAPLVLCDVQPNGLLPCFCAQKEGNLSDLDCSTRKQVVFDDGEGTESMTVAIPGRGLTKVTINTSKIQEKAQMARAVYEHAVALQDSFGPYSQSCLDAFLPLVEFKFSSEIRATSAQTLAAVFDAACCFGTSHGMDLPKAYLPRLLNTIARQMSEEDSTSMEVVQALVTSLCDICNSTYAHNMDHGMEILGNLSLAQVRTVVKCCVKAIGQSLERRKTLFRSLEEDNAQGDDERNEIANELACEQVLLTPLVDSIGYLLKCYGPSFAPIFGELVAPTLGLYLGDGNGDICARLAAVCLFDDCVEHCGGEAAAKFGPSLLVGILSSLQANHEDDELVRAAIYGIAQLVRNAPAPVLAPHAQLLVQDLLRRVDRPVSGDGESDEDSALYENAISALASMTLFNNAPFRASGFAKRETVTKCFLQSLPLRSDKDEAKICHAEFCTLVETGAVPIDGDTFAPIANAILACVNDEEEVATMDTCQRLQDLLQQWRQQNPTSNSGQGGLTQLSEFACIVSP